MVTMRNKNFNSRKLVLFTGAIVFSVSVVVSVKHPSYVVKKTRLFYLFRKIVQFLLLFIYLFIYLQMKNMFTERNITI